MFVTASGTILLIQLAVYFFFSMLAKVRLGSLSNFWLVTIAKVADRFLGWQRSEKTEVFLLIMKS